MLFSYIQKTHALSHIMIMKSYRRIFESTAQTSQIFKCVTHILSPHVETLLYSCDAINEMIGVLCHDSALVRLYWAGDNLNFATNHAPGAGSIARPVDQLPLYHARSHFLSR